MRRTRLETTGLMHCGCLFRALSPVCPITREEAAFACFKHEIVYYTFDNTVRETWKAANTLPEESLAEYGVKIC